MFRKWLLLLLIYINKLLIIIIIIQFYDLKNVRVILIQSD